MTTVAALPGEVCESARYCGRERAYPSLPWRYLTSTAEGSVSPGHGLVRDRVPQGAHLQPPGWQHCRLRGPAGPLTVDYDPPSFVTTISGATDGYITFIPGKGKFRDIQAEGLIDDQPLVVRRPMPDMGPGAEERRLIIALGERSYRSWSLGECYSGRGDRSGVIIKSGRRGLRVSSDASPHEVGMAILLMASGLWNLTTSGPLGASGPRGSRPR